MAVRWTNSGLDLHVELDRTRVRGSLEDALRDAVRAGRLVPGATLPPSRALAEDLGIARNTVVDVYAQLVAEGWLEARQGSATRVARVDLPADGRSPVERRPLRGAAYDMRAGAPDVSGFPRAEWAAAVRRVLSDMPSAALGYGDPRGRPELRLALAEYLGRARGVRADPSAVVVCSGYGEALWLLARVLRAQGGRDVAVEAYGHAQHRALLADAGLHPVPLAVDEDGAVVGELGAVCAAVLTPAHQFPLGWALSPARRLDALRWARETGGVVVEDDYDAEFRYDRRGVGAVQPMAPDHVVHAGTASKTLAPGLRLAWLVLPPALVEPVVELRRLLMREAPVVDQLALARLLADGRYDRHVRRARLAYRRRREELVEVLARRAPAVAVVGLPAGLHSVLRLDPGDDEHAAVARAARREVVIEGLSSYALGPTADPPSVVVGWGAIPSHAFRPAVRRLATALAR